MTKLLRTILVLGAPAVLLAACAVPPPPPPCDACALAQQAQATANQALSVAQQALAATQSRGVVYNRSLRK